MVVMEGGVVETVEIPLTGRVGAGLFAIVNAADLPLVAGYRWNGVRGRHTTYARTSIRRAGKRTTVDMHRLILQGVPRIDHADGDGLNNRRSNLRPATAAENTRNSCLRCTNASGFKGVTWHGQRNKWRAQLERDGKHISLGLYFTPEDAARAYDRAALELFGEFALTNLGLGLLGAGCP
jgi:hypothetical protein